MRRAVLALVAVACGLAGGWLAPRAAGPATYETEVASLRFDLAVSTPADRGVSVFVPLADWGVRARVVGAPVQVSVEPRAIDRAAVVGMATSGTAPVVHRLRRDLDASLRRLLTRTLVLTLAGALLGGALAALLWHAAGMRGRRLWLAPTAAAGSVVVALAALGGWAAASWSPERLDHPRYFASGQELSDILGQADALRRSGQKYSDRVDNAIHGIAGLLNGRSTGGSGALGVGGSPASGTTERVVLASDIHNNLLALPALRGFTRGHPTILDGDFTINGGRMEAPLLKGLDGIGDPVVATSGNHDSPGIMRALARQGITVLDHEDGIRRIAGLEMVAFEDPLEFEGREFPGGIRTGLSFGDIPDGHERFLEAIQQRWRWWQALPRRPDVLIMHQEAIGRALANLIWEQDRDGDPLTILVAHTHVQRMDRYGPITTVNSGTAGAGGLFGIGSQSVGVALMDFDRGTGDLVATDLVQVNPSTSAARAQRVITSTPECDDELVFCHESPELPATPTPTPSG